MEFPKTQYMSKKMINHVETLADSNPQFQSILANLIFSANNPFQENFPFIQDTTFKTKSANLNGHSGMNKSSLQQILHDD